MQFSSFLKAERGQHITAKIAQWTAAVATERAMEANYAQVFIILMCYDKCSANKRS